MLASPPATDRASLADPPPACPACGARAGQWLAAPAPWRLARCRDCGLGYLDPMPDSATVAALYHDAYAGASEGYFAKVAAKMRRARQRIRLLRRHAPAGRFLDIGCNGGFLVEAAREAGFEAHGLELDPVSLAYARKHYPANRYFHGRVEDYAPGITFDAVVCSEVIEHVPAVGRFVRSIAALMAPGAVLYLTTPDFGHWRRPGDLARWDAFCPPAHCLFFTRAALDRLLARHGLAVIARRPAWKPGIKLFARKTG